MKPLLLVVEDNPDVLYNIKLTLEFNDYEVITAENGLEAIEVLSKLENPPDLIVSDITMPKMNGYDLFKTVSENPLWSNIPFIFLTARTSPKDVRFGKMLGVDDYMLKPFKEEDLLATIAGKIARNRKVDSINKKIADLFQSLQLDTLPSIPAGGEESVIFLYVKWDDKIGPDLQAHYPPEISLPLKPAELGYQLFNGVSSIYGQKSIHEARGILLNIENIKHHGYSFFDAIHGSGTRGNEIPFMLAVVAQKINFFNSLHINVVFYELAQKIKQKEPWDIKEYWEKISKILTTPVL